MASGPSKEELEMYWKSSRQYFDELANYYRTADPNYYNEYIAPFYGNPLYSITSSEGTSSRAPRPIAFLAIAIFVLVFAAGLVFFFLLSENTADKETPPKKEEKIEKKEKVQQRDTVKATVPKTRKDRSGRKQPIERIR